MTNYEITTKPAFTVLGIGTTLSGSYQELPAQKQAFWTKTVTTPRYQSLREQAQSPYEFAVNEAVDGAMYYYAGVQTETKPATEQERAIQFPAGDYLVVHGQAETDLALFGQLEGTAFGQVLPSLKDQAYVGGPNASVITAKSADQVSGEMWIPVVHQ